ncbi:interleukin-17 receptor A [Bombina bombina]|uniref:interleukin-17 receptor A n=1 Tax=Bombina bombina TaxID=8345 RepID=UPI00235AF2EF|nr:interleukin-17 receptor A [Bombina bombina]
MYRRWLLGALWLASFTCSTHGLRVIDYPEFNCSQTGIQCSTSKSFCIDRSWLYPETWTPSSPSAIDVRVSVAQNEAGRSVPILKIKWTVAKDASILQLQGVEVSILQLSNNYGLCVQFQFGNTFPDQVNKDQKEWQFFYNNFEVEPGQTYHVRVQHLPMHKYEAENRKELNISVPGCSDRVMSSTDSCCDTGYCWQPNISLEQDANKLMVNFDPQTDACRYLIIVNNHGTRSYKPVTTVTLQQEECSRRVNVSFPLIPSSPICWYNVQIQPSNPKCENDCKRYIFTPECTPEPTSYLAVSHKRIHLCPIAVCIPVLLVILLAIPCLSKESNSDPAPPIVDDDVAMQKVWLVYSADHSLYVDVVMKLAVFLRGAWGLDVVLDLLHQNEIAEIGLMTWLSRQKSTVESLNGTVLVLCSRGTQEKWKAKLIPDGPQVRLREERVNCLGDCFSPALNFIIPDIQNGLYDRYIVAYFGDLNDHTDIPSLFLMCPKYNLTRDLQEVFFRIQKKERHQPTISFSVTQEGAPGYDNLKEAVRRCQAWQKERVDWFKNESSVEITEFTERSFEPEITVSPEPGISILSPIITDPACATVKMSPVILDAPPIHHLITDLIDDGSTIKFQCPQMVSDKPREFFKKEPCLVERGNALVIQSELSIDSQPDQGYQSWITDSPMIDAQSLDFLSAAQARLFQQSQGDYLEACEPQLNMELAVVAGKVAPLHESGYLSFDRELDMDFVRDEQLKLFNHSGGWICQQ